MTNYIEKMTNLLPQKYEYPKQIQTESELLPIRVEKQGDSYFLQKLDQSKINKFYQFYQERKNANFKE